MLTGITVATNRCTCLLLELQHLGIADIGIGGFTGFSGHKLDDCRPHIDFTRLTDGIQIVHQTDKQEQCGCKSADG